MAIPSIVQTASNQNAGGATTLDLTFSVTPTAGNLMLAAIAVRGGSGTTITPPTGWTLIRRIDNGTTISLALYSRVNQSGAVQTYTWTFSSSQKASGGIREIAGIHPTTPIVAENGGTNASSTTHNTVAVSTLVADTLMIASFATATGTTATPKSGWTEGYVQATTGGSAGTRTTSEGQSIPFATITSTNGTVVWGTAAVGASHVAVIQGATSQSYTQSLALSSSGAFVSTPTTTNPNAPQTISFVGATTQNFTAQTSVVLAVPAGTQVGDTLVSFFHLDSTAESVSAVPSGWTNVQGPIDSSTGDCRSYAYVKNYINGDPTSFTWTLSASSADGSASLLSYHNVDATTPVQTSSGVGTASGATQTTAAITTTTNGCMIIIGATADKTSTAFPSGFWTQPAGFTERYDVEQPSTLSESSAADMLQTTAGTNSWTLTMGEADESSLITIALKPAVSTGGTTYNGALALSSTGTVAAQGRLTLKGALTLPASTSSTMFGKRAVSGSLALVSSATFVPTYASTFPSNTYGAGIYGSGIYGGTSATAGALTLTASGSSSALGQIRQTIGCSFIATSGFAPIPVRRVVTGLTLAANLNTLLGFKRALVMQTSLSASTTMGATALRLIKATSQLSGTSTLISVGQRKQVATSTFSATSTALFTVAGRKTAQLSLSASGTFGSLALRRVVGSVALTGASSSTLLPRKYIVSTFSGSSTSTSTFSVKRLLTLPLSLSGTASAATTPKKMLRGTATFSSLTQVAANPHRKVVGSFSSNFTSSLTATTQGISTAAVSFSSTLNSTILGRLQRTATLSFGSTSTFLSAPVRRLTKNVVFVSVGTLNAVAGVTVENSYGYAAFSAGSYGGFSTETFSESLNLLASTGFILSPMLHTTKGKLQGAPAIFRAEQVVPIALLREERGLPIAVFHEQQIPSAVQAIRGELSSPITAARAEQATPLAVMRTTQSAPIILLRTENTMPIVLTRQESLNTPAIIRNVIER